MKIQPQKPKKYGIASGKIMKPSQKTVAKACKTVRVNYWHLMSNN